jgi:hypothetical protein
VIICRLVDCCTSRPVRGTGYANPVFCLSVTLRRRWSWAAAAIGAAAAAAVTALSGCAPAAPANAAAGAGHVLTIAEARAAYASYLAVSDAAAAQGNRDQALSVAAYAQWALVKSQFTALASAGTPVPRYRYGRPAFYVPALTGYPEWFMVAAPRAAGSGPAVTALMVFERARPASPWTLDGAAVLGRPLPAIARNSDGYAVAVATSDQGLLLRPDVVGATQAAVVDDGPASPAAAVVAAGPQTTGLYAAQAAQARAAAARGLQYQWLLQGAPFWQFQLRTADGGALVMYGMNLDTVTEHPNLVAGSPIAVPAQVAALFTAPDEIGYHALYANWTYEFAAIDPAPGIRNARLQVIGAAGGPTYGHAY